MPFNGFNAFLGTEYHQLNPNLDDIDELVFTNNYPDVDIRHKLLVRLVNGIVLTYGLFEDGAGEDLFKIPLKDYVAELVYVAYTVNENPYVTGTGRVFNVTIVAQ